MRVSAVIGANLGDEGKGRVVDFLSGPGSLVVRFSGGAQAGHTVVRDGRRHVFHHFGSAAMNDVPTFLGRHFIANPLVFRDEWNELEGLGLAPVVYIDPRCRLTTPWDMMLNQLSESARGSARHGSCGLGINETVTRSQDIHRQLLAFDAWDSHFPLEERLHAIRTAGTARSLALGIPSLPSYYWSPRILERFVDDLRWMMERVVVQGWSAGILDTTDHVIFEGAQGLRLDEFGQDFPHVTRGRTGLTHVVEMYEEAGLGQFTEKGRTMDIYYVTRPYVTRHGAGPLAYEVDGRPYPGIIDRTNIPNPYQGTLRFGWMDADRLVAEIQRDSQRTAFHMTAWGRLVVTCADQLPDNKLRWYAQREERLTPLREWTKHVCERAVLHGEPLVMEPGGHGD